MREFFATLGSERSAKLQVVTMDLSGSYISAVTEKATQAHLVFDRFHVQRLRSYGFSAPSSLTAYIYLCCTGIHLLPVRHYPRAA